MIHIQIGVRYEIQINAKILKTLKKKGYGNHSSPQVSLWTGNTFITLLGRNVSAMTIQGYFPYTGCLKSHAMILKHHIS